MFRNEKGQFVKGDKTLGGWNKGLKGYTNAGSFKKGQKPKNGFAKGHIPWNKGVKTGVHFGIPYEKGNIPWNKGKVKEDAGYTAKHDYIRYYYGNPKNCEVCHSTTEKMYDWHNISKDYKRERSDWLRLCRKCHIKVEKENGVQYGRKQTGQKD